MRIGVLGTGVVGLTLAGRLIGLGHEVTMGARQAGNEKATAWAAGAGPGASAGTFAEAAAFGELVVNATSGTVSVAAITAAGAHNLVGKVVIDVSNPLDFSQGMPPTLSVCNTDSMGETLQREFPEARIVKSLNTVNADVMVHPEIAGAGHTMFLCGNDTTAKLDVRALLESFGWPAGDILDLGDIGAARGMEMYLPLWLRLWGALGTGHFNVRATVAD